MELTPTVPGLLFPTISLLLLAYTNRFLGIAGVVRALHARYEASPDKRLLPQIDSLRRRLRLVRDMQLVGVLSILLAVVTIGLLYGGLPRVAHWTFVTSLLLMIVSLLMSAWEVKVSTDAIELHLRSMEGN